MHFRCFFGLYCAAGFSWFFFCSVLLVFCLFFSLFGTFVFETSCILGVSLVCIVLLVFLGSIFVVFCFCFLFVFSFWDFCF